MTEHTDTDTPTEVGRLPEGITLPPTGLSITQRLNMVAMEVEAVAKDRQGNAGAEGKYKFRGIDDVMNAVHHLFGKWGVVVSYDDINIDCEVVSRGGKPWRHYLVTVQWTFIGWDGDELVVENTGEGLDNSDKGLGKARSYALKDYLTRCLTLPTDDPAQDNEATKVPDADAPGPSRTRHSDGTPMTPDEEAQQLGYDDAADRQHRWDQVVAFIKEHVPEQLRGPLRERMHPNITDPELSNLHNEAMKIATRAIEARTAGDTEPPPDEVADTEPDAVAAVPNQPSADEVTAALEGKPTAPSNAEQVAAAREAIADAGRIESAELLNLNKAQLVTACRERGLPTNGSMAELRRRIKVHQGDLAADE